MKKSKEIPKKERIVLSKRFLKSHPRAGQETHFIEKFLSGQKIHTIRVNNVWWYNAINDVMSGKADLHVSTWADKPYGSKMETVKVIKGGGSDVGIEFVRFDILKNNYPLLEQVAKNDGLSVQDLLNWFKDVADETVVSIVHFTPFRYNFLP